MSTKRFTQRAFVITNTLFVVGDWASVPAHNGSFSFVNIDTYVSCVFFFNKFSSIWNVKVSALSFRHLRSKCSLTVDGKSAGLASEPKIIPDTPFSIQDKRKKGGKLLDSYDNRVFNAHG